MNILYVVFSLCSGMISNDCVHTHFAVVTTEDMATMQRMCDELGEIGREEIGKQGHRKIRMDCFYDTNPLVK